MQEQEKLDEAMACYHRAAELNPDLAEAQPIWLLCFSAWGGSTTRSRLAAVRWN